MDAARRFPTLAERLAVGGRSTGAGGDRPPLTIWIEADAMTDADAVGRVLGAAPAASLVAVIGGGVVRTAQAAHADTGTLADWPARPLRDLDDLRALLDDAPGADVVVVEPERDLDAAIVDELAADAYADSVCASVSSGARPGEPATTDRRGIPPPAIDSPSWGLVYVRRDALDLGLDNARALDGGDAGTTGSVRELLAGLLSGAGFVNRYSGPAPSPASGGDSQLERTRGSSINVTMDVRHLVAPVTGTQVQSLALLDALARTGEVLLTALAPPRMHPSVVPLVEPLRDRVAFSTRVPVETTDVFYRPHQVGSLDELAECLAFGRRFVLTHQDMIGDRTPAYSSSRRDLEYVRGTTRAALAAADHVGFFSEHAALDAASDGVLDPERATVVPLGVDHIRTDGPVEAPPQLATLKGRPFLLVLGTSFGHKNRLFALRVLQELVVERGWDGGLVLAGRDVPLGSSVPDERRLLTADPRLRERVVVVDHVPERAKRALYRDAALVLFPSLYEGFGLVPFEAAAFGTPCLYAWRGSLPEFLPRAGALPSDFSVPATASLILGLLESAAAREALVSEIRTASATLTWDDTARGYLEVFRRALDGPPRPLDRAILRGAGVGADGIPVSAMERAVIQVYRRRTGFKRALDAVVRVGGIATRTTRRGRARHDAGVEDCPSERSRHL